MASPQFTDGRRRNPTSLSIAIILRCYKMTGDILTFGQATELSEGPDRSVLLGNGFSIARAGGVFNYANLLDKSNLPESSSIRNVFRMFGTFDFEEVMRALEHAARIEEAYGDKVRSAKFRDDAALVREALIHAVRAVHPEIQSEIPDSQAEKCATFLNLFCKIFTLNYDLQLYWVILRAKEKKHADGFGLGEVIEGFKTFSEIGTCSTYYLHGALHLFESENGDTQKRVRTGSTIVDDIAETIRKRRTLPLFVAEGTTVQKLRKINSVAYLRHCYETLRNIAGDLFIFGHSVSDNDIHIYDAIFSAVKLSKLFFCVHNPRRNLLLFREKLARFAERRKGDVEIHYIDSATVRIWD